MAREAPAVKQEIWDHTSGMITDYTERLGRKLLQTQESAQSAALAVLASRQGYNVVACSTGACILNPGAVLGRNSTTLSPSYAAQGLDILQFCSGSVTLVSASQKLGQ